MSAEPDFRWTQDDWGHAAPSAQSSPWRDWSERHGRIVRGAIVLVGLLAFELTANAAVATAASCLELGRTDFGTARWLWAVDPDRRRGRLTALCYLAGGCCRVGIMAMAATCCIPILVVWFDPPGPRLGPPQHLVGALIIMVATLLTSAAISLGVSVAALLSGRKLWLGPEPRLARRQGSWPPSQVVWPKSRHPNNEMEALLLLASLLVFVPGFSLLIWTCAQVQGGVRVSCYLAIPLLSMGFIVGVKGLQDRVQARSPAECWPIDEPVSNGTGVGLS